MSDEKPKLSQEEWEKIVDQAFDLDEKHPFLGQTTEESSDEGV